MQQVIICIHLLRKKRENTLPASQGILPLSMFLCVGVISRVLLLVSKVVPCAVMLHVLVRRPLVNMTENSYSVLGFKPVTM